MVFKSIKKVLPIQIKRPVRQGIKFVKYNYRKTQITKAVRLGQPIKIIVGAAETFQSGWLATNEQWLDITNPQDWETIFQGKQLLSSVVAEHVFEHLTSQESLAALSYIHQHLVQGGSIRIAVPDGYHPDPDYLRHVGINGLGDDAADHKQLLNADSLSELLEQANFSNIQVVEGYDEAGNLTQEPWQAARGFVHRSRQNKSCDVWDFVDASTSLIIDAQKV